MAFACLDCYGDVSGASLPCRSSSLDLGSRHIWVVVKIMVPFWVPILIRGLIFRVPKRDHNFDIHPYRVNIVVIRVRVSSSGSHRSGRGHE